MHRGRVGRSDRARVAVRHHREVDLGSGNGDALQVERDREVHRPAPAGVGQSQGARHGVRDAAGVGDHFRQLGDRPRHAYLIDFLHRPAAQFRQLRRPADRQQRPLAVHRIGQRRHHVGEPRRGGDHHTRLASDARPGVRHVCGRLLVPRVDQAEAAVGHLVQHRQYVIAGDGERLPYPRQRQGTRQYLRSGEPTERHPQPCVSSSSFLSCSACRRDGPSRVPRAPCTRDGGTGDRGPVAVLPCGHKAARSE